MLLGTDKLKMRCPFHKEKSPSMVVHRPENERATFYCFGCGKNGKVSEHRDVMIPALVNLMKKIWSNLFEPLEEPKLLTDLRAMSDDILSLSGQLEGLDEKISQHWDLNYKALENLSKMISELETHKTRQVDENRKISRRVDELEKANIMKSEMIGAVDSAYDEACRGYEKRLNELETHISKLHDMINLEDRITACDVLNRLTMVEARADTINKNVLPHANVEMIIEMNIRNVQERIDGLETEINTVRALGSRAFHPQKKPHTCPVCKGTCMRPNPLSGSFNANLPVNLDCIVCEGKGIVWG